jgi:serine/threonine protein kinase
LIGRTLSHFKILAKIGEGGMGVVYRAEDEKLRRPVALKVLPPDLVANEERRLRFLREARTAAVIIMACVADPSARGVRGSSDDNLLEPNLTVSVSRSLTRCFFRPIRCV